MASIFHVLMCQLDKAFKERADKEFSKVQSPKEAEMLHVLLKFYHLSEIELQKPVGRYRLDFFTADKIAWEVDGKEYHDRDKDLWRDSWILRNSDTKAIVRIPADVLHWHQRMVVDAAFCILKDCPIPECSQYVLPEQAISGWDMLPGGCDERYVPEEDYVAFRRFDAESCSSCRIRGNKADIGCGLAFMPKDHEGWNYVDPSKKNLYQWFGTVEVRTLESIGSV